MSELKAVTRKEKLMKAAITGEYTYLHGITREEKLWEHIANNGIVSANSNSRMKVNGFLAILDSTEYCTNKNDEKIMKNINDLADACFDGYAICVEVMPSYNQKKDYEKRKITQKDLVFNCYPSLEVLNQYINIAKSKGLCLREIKFHNLWICKQASSLNLASAIESYSEVVKSILNGLQIKPVHATIINEANNLITADTIPTLKDLLVFIKNKGMQTGFTCSNTPEELIDYVDNYYYHFYPPISTKGANTSFQDSIDGWNSSRIYEKRITKNRIKHPEKNSIIDEVGCASYWESLAAPEQWLGGKGLTVIENGMPMAIYIYGALEYFSQFVDVKEIYVFWTDTVPSKLKEVIKNYKGVV